MSLLNRTKKLPVVLPLVMVATALFGNLANAQAKEVQDVFKIAAAQLIASDNGSGTFPKEQMIQALSNAIEQVANSPAQKGCLTEKLITDFQTSVSLILAQNLDNFAHVLDAAENLKNYYDTMIANSAKDADNVVYFDDAVSLTAQSMLKITEDQKILDSQNANKHRSTG